MMKKVVTKMYMMKINEIATLLSYFMTMSSPTASMALNRISGHISKVEISKNVIML